MKGLRLLVLLVAVPVFLSTLGAADTVSFGPCITNNNVVDCNGNVLCAILLSLQGIIQSM